MNERKILPFVRPEKPKQESAIPAYEKSAPAVRIVRELAPEQAGNFILKFSWIVDVLGAIKQSDPHAIKSANVHNWLERLDDASDDFLKKTTMEATRFLVDEHASYYEALTDKIIERKLNKPKKR